MLGPRPLLGRTFTPEEDQPKAAGVVVLSEDLRRPRFSSNPDIVGTVLTAGEGEAAKPYEVIGVMPHDFRIARGRTHEGRFLNVEASSDPRVFGSARSSHPGLRSHTRATSLFI